MPSRSPSQSDFPPSHTITITLPSTQRQDQPPANILLLLHGIGDSAAGFTNFARALNLPETAVVTLQAPTPLPFDLPGFHWGDDISFDSRSGELDMDAGFAKALRIIVDEVVLDTLVGKCGYRLREIMVLGLGQGGMVGLSAARELGRRVQGQEGELGGVVSVGAPFPLSGSATGPKNRTPVLVVAGRDSPVVSDGAVRRTEGVFEFVEVARYQRKGDGMPRSREEMMPLMRFFARRLLSRQGVPEGSIEVTGLG